MNKEYLTVKELSEQVGITTQAIYKKLQTDYQPYLQLVKGKKCLNIKVLELFEEQEVATDLQPNLQLVTSLLQQQNEQIQKQMNLLQEELAIKNKQIDELNARLAEAHRMTEQAHYLQGAEKIEKLADASSSVPTQEQEPPKQSKSFLSKFLKK